MERTGTTINAPVWQPTPVPKQAPGNIRSPQLPEGRQDERQGAASHDQDHYSEPKAGAIFDNVAAAIATVPPVAAPASQPVTVPQTIQPKLTIGAPGDQYEQEADRVAEQVVQRLQASSAAGVPGEGAAGDRSVQRKPQLTIAALSPQPQEAVPNPNGTKLQLQCQRQADASEATPEFETALNSASGGQPLASQFRLQAENLMGADFSGVKIHTDGAADQLNQSIQAKAFTTRQDIFFRQGEYNPSSSEGQTLLAHELTHVIQQNSGTVRRKEDGAAIALSTPSQNVIQADKDHLAAPPLPPKDAIPAKDAMPDPLPRNKPVPPPLLSDALDAQDEKKKDAQGQNNNASQVQEDPTKLQFNRSRADAQWTKSLTPPPMMSEVFGNPLNGNEFQNSQEDENLSSGPQPMLSNGVVSDAYKLNIEFYSGFEATEIDKLQESLKSTGESYSAVDIAAMATESLYYGFEEDQSYVDRFGEMAPEEIEATEKENLDQIESIKAQLKDKNIKPDETKELEAQKHELEQELVYLKQMKGANQAAQEAADASSWTEKAKNYMVENYQTRSKVSLILADVQRLRQEFDLPSKEASESYKNDKHNARAKSSALANEAFKLKLDAETKAEELKTRKKSLTKVNRIAPEFAEDPKKWMKNVGASKVKVKFKDFKQGLKSGGFKEVKADKDKRGILKPSEDTTVLQEAREACAQIENERKIINSITFDSGLAIFSLADSVVSILQQCDRGVWKGLKRIVRFVKLYMSALSSLPIVGPIFATIAGVLSIVSGVISGLQAITNMIIATIRGVQIWKGDARLRNILMASAVNASVGSLGSSLKAVLFGLDQGGQMDQLSDLKPDYNYINVNIANQSSEENGDDNLVDHGLNKLENKVEDKTNSIDDKLNTPLNPALYVKRVGQKTGTLTKAAVNQKNKAVKNMKKVEDGDITGNMSDQSIADQAILTMFKKAVESVLGKVGGFQGQADPLAQQVRQSGSDLEATSSKADLKDNQDENAPESLKVAKESGGTLQNMSAAIKDAADVVGS